VFTTAGRVHPGAYKRARFAGGVWCALVVRERERSWCLRLALSTCSASSSAAHGLSGEWGAVRLAVGGNDIALAPLLATIVSIATLVLCTPQVTSLLRPLTSAAASDHDHHHRRQLTAVSLRGGALHVCPGGAGELCMRAPAQLGHRSWLLWLRLAWLCRGRGEQRVNKYAAAKHEIAAGGECSLPCACDGYMQVGWPPGFGYLVDLFLNRVQNYITRLVAKHKPRTVVVCMYVPRSLPSKQPSCRDVVLLLLPSPC
jgi:hypothetical protein